MRKIYAIEIIERKPKTTDTQVVFTKVLPSIPVKGKMPKTIEELQERIEQMDAPTYEKTAVLNGIGFAVDVWFPTHFYRIAKVDWKYP